ncbi:MAG: 50S ribosomal protein L3 [Gammaproteobacteria bacterium]
MAIGLIGRKRGMTRIFTEDGASVPVTVIEALPNRVMRVKSAESDGYTAVQVTTGSVKPSRINKADAGQFAKAGAEPGEGLWEFRVTADEAGTHATGSEITVEAFTVGQMVDVRGTTLGKGYAGTIKRHNFQSQDATHGNSVSHRAPGSIGQRQTPGRVFKGKRMSGHMGNVARSTLNLAVIRVDKERNLLLVKGAVPGHAGSQVMVRPASKVRRKRKG